MRKGWKLFWITTAGIFGAGLLLLGAGVAAGGTLDMIQSRFPHGIYIGDHERAGLKQEVAPTLDTSGIETYHAITDYVDSLDIDVSGVAVTLKYEARDDIEVSVEEVPKKCRLQIYEEDGTLEIETESGSKHEAGRITVSIPEGKVFREVDIASGLGEVYADRIEADDLSVDVGAGIVELSYFRAQELSVDCGIGTATLRGAVIRHGDIDCGAGEVVLTLAGAEADYQYIAECGIGTVTIGENNYSGVRVGSELGSGTNETGRMIEIDNGIGATTIEFDGTME